MPSEKMPLIPAYGVRNMRSHSPIIVKAFCPHRAAPAQVVLPFAKIVGHTHHATAGRSLSPLVWDEGCSAGFMNRARPVGVCGLTNGAVGSAVLSTQ